MSRRLKVAAGIGSIGAAAACISAGALAASGPPPKRASVKSVTKFEVKINRYVKSNLRWNKDTYQVRSGGTVRVTNGDGQEGPHTFTVVSPKDLPKTQKQVFECKICKTLGQAHGADPNSEAPPTNPFLENGVGQATPPVVDRAGDSAFVGDKKGDSVTLTVAAKKGTTLRFMCLIHPWMQGKLLVR